jgi:hypothetical protein
MDEETPKQPVEEATPPVAPPPALRPSQPLPPHPAFAMVVKTRRSRIQLYGGAVILVLVVALFAVYGWQHGKVTTLTTQKLAADQAVDKLNNQIVPLEAAAKTSSSTGAGNQNVVTIPQLGIELSVPASLKTLTYYYASSASGKVVDLSTTTLADLSSSCAETLAKNTGNGNALGGLFRGTGTGAAGAGVMVVKQFSGYYVAFVAPQATCATSDSSAVAAAVADETADLKASFSTIQLLP